MNHTSAPGVTRRFGPLIGGIVAIGAVVVALAQSTDAQSTGRGPDPRPVPSSQASVATPGPQITRPGRPLPAPTATPSAIGGTATPTRCVEVNGGDRSACNVGNSGRGDLPYRIAPAGLR